MIPSWKRSWSGQSVALTAGSRGIANIPLILKSTAQFLKDLGAKPFLVPAMGSHGGGTAEGQRKVLESYGITEAFVGVPIQASMEVIQAGTTPDGFPVYLDKHASEADHIGGVGQLGHGFGADERGRFDHREARLKTQLEIVRPQYDFVIIDCPPALSWLTINAFTASKKVLVPVAPGYFELDSIVQIGKTIQEVRQMFNPEIELTGLLYTMSDPTVNAKTSLSVLRQTYTGVVLKTIIPRNTDIRDAHFNKKDIFTFAPDSKSAQAYTRLLVELFKL